MAYRRLYIAINIKHIAILTKIQQWLIYFTSNHSCHDVLCGFAASPHPKAPQLVREKQFKHIHKQFYTALCFSWTAVIGLLTLNLMLYSQLKRLSALLCEINAPQYLLRIWDTESHLWLSSSSTLEIIPLNSSQRSWMVLALLCSLLEINSSPLAVSQTALKRRLCPKETQRSSILSSEPQTILQITFQW